MSDTFHEDPHTDLKADYILGNHPLYVSDWGASSATTPAGIKGVPPAGNANYAWLSARCSPRRTS